MKVTGFLTINGVQVPYSGIAIPLAIPFTDTITPTSNTAYNNSVEYTAANGSTAVIQANCWGTGNSGFKQQTTWATNDAMFGVTSNHVNDGLVKSYSGYVRGWKYGQGILTPNDSVLGQGGVQFQALTRYRARFGFTGPSDYGALTGIGATNRVNTLFDIYAHKKAKPTNGEMPTLNLMVMPYTIDGDGAFGVYAKTATVISIGGQQWGYATKLSPNWAGATEIAVWPLPFNDYKIWGQKDITVNLLPLIQYFIAQKLITPTDYLTSHQMGWEIIAGGVYATTACWTALQGDSPGTSGPWVST